ncbi:hypothetical protein [Neorhizobium sp. NCHU2750]|uniref:hypothetical protein n=1 Tax=Neorhizobium sp. NCHU2750 TaxID=1825976 RepID=UPI000E739293
MVKVAASACLLMLAALPAKAQSFSCRGGTQPACLDYGAKVCSPFAKCVDQNAVVFDRFTCDYKGFVCKSTLDDVAGKYDSVVTKFNALLDENNQLVDKYNALLRVSRDLDSCVGNASNIDEAKRCLP